MKYINLCLADDHIGLVHLDDLPGKYPVASAITGAKEIPLEEQHEIVSIYLDMNKDTMPKQLVSLIQEKLRKLRDYIINDNQDDEEESTETSSSTNPLHAQIGALETKVLSLESIVASIGQANTGEVSAKTQEDILDTLINHPMVSAVAIAWAEHIQASTRLINSRAHCQELENKVIIRDRGLEEEN